mmetsp:Transcript_20032/g.66663  ORF Transcript_20032/g.66663 Transcript_20032/m.66663 type:complete len:282 (+) Transcript_20032:2137-2982(+)
MEVAQDDGDLSAGNDEDDEDQCKESKHVIETVLPNGRDNEEHLDKYSSKGQKSSHYNGRWKLQVPELGRNLTGDGVSLHWDSHRVLLVSQEGSEEYERQRNTKPQQSQDHESSKRNCSRRSLRPSDKVHHKENGKADSREDGRSPKGCLEMVVLLEHLAETSRHVASWKAHQHEEDEDRGEKCSAVGWRQESQGSEQKGQDSHNEQLQPRSRHDTEESSKRRSTEDIRVDELPASLLTHLTIGLRKFFLSKSNLVVSGKILAENAGHNQPNNTGEEDEDDK